MRQQETNNTTQKTPEKFGRSLFALASFALAITLSAALFIVATTHGTFYLLRQFKTPVLIAVASAALSLVPALWALSLFAGLRSFLQQVQRRCLHASKHLEQRRCPNVFVHTILRLPHNLLLSLRLLAPGAGLAALCLLCFDLFRLAGQHAGLVQNFADLRDAALLLPALYVLSLAALLVILALPLGLCMRPRAVIATTRAAITTALRSRYAPDSAASLVAVLLSLGAYLSASSCLLYRVLAQPLSALSKARRGALWIALAAIVTVLLFYVLRWTLRRAARTAALQNLFNMRILLIISSIFLCLGATLAMLRERQIFKELDGWLLYSEILAGLLFLLATLFGSKKRPPARKSARLATRAGVFVTLSLALSLLLGWPPGSPRALAWLDFAGRNTSFFMHFWQQLSDLDGDGYSGLLGGGDCAPRDPFIFPGAVEFIDNGIDEDCDGQDLTASTEADKGPELTHPYHFSQPPNFLLISIDALRRDALGIYAAGSDHSPNIDAFARKAQIFDSAWSAASWTMPSLGATFTGVYASEIPGYYGQVHMRRVPRKLPLLTDPLRRAGYKTTAITGGLKLNELGLDRAFDQWINLGSDWKKRYAAAQVKKVRQTLQAQDPQKPFLLWTHFIDVHDPYTAPKRDQLFGNTRRGRYAAALHHLDELLGPLLRWFALSAQARNTVVVFFADHGEAFGEHGFNSHGHSVYHEELGIPLFFILPKAPARHIKGPVSLLDLGPTLWDLAGLDPPELAKQRGHSLAVALRTGRLQAPLQPVIAEQTVRTREFALISPQGYLRHDQSRRRVQLFALGADKLQQHDLSSRRPLLTARMDRLLMEKLNKIRYLSSKNLDKVLFRSLPRGLHGGFDKFIGGPRLAGYQLLKADKKNLRVALWFVPDALPDGASYEADIRVYDAQKHLLGRRKNYVTKSIYYPTRWRSFDRVRHIEDLRLNRDVASARRLCVAFLVDNKPLPVQGTKDSWNCVPFETQARKN